MRRWHNEHNYWSILRQALQNYHIYDKTEDIA